MQFWEELAWQTPLTPTECVALLNSDTEEDTASRWLGLGFHPRGTILRSLEGRSIRLLAKGPLFVRNSFEPYFYGDLIESQGRAVIRGRFRIHPLPLIFMTLWLGGVLAIGGLIFLICAVELITGRNYGDGDLPPWPGLVAGPGMFLFGTGMVALGWWLGRTQRRSIQRFIETTLQGQRLPVPENGWTLFKAGIDAS